MRGLLEGQKDLTFLEETVTIRSAMTEADKTAIAALAEALLGKTEAPEPQAPVLKRWVCTVCGYVYEGESLPEDFTCPLCMQDASVFAPVEPEL